MDGKGRWQDLVVSRVCCCPVVVIAVSRSTDLVKCILVVSQSRDLVNWFLLLFDQMDVAVAATCVVAVCVEQFDALNGSCCCCHSTGFKSPTGGSVTCSGQCGFQNG